MDFISFAETISSLLKGKTIECYYTKSSSFPFYEIKLQGSDLVYASDSAAYKAGERVSSLSADLFFKIKYDPNDTDNWIGKLCKFRNGDEDFVYGFFRGMSMNKFICGTGRFLFDNDHEVTDKEHRLVYDHCEPLTSAELESFAVKGWVPAKSDPAE